MKKKGRRGREKRNEARKDTGREGIMERKYESRIRKTGREGGNQGSRHGE